MKIKILLLISVIGLAVLFVLSLPDAKMKVVFCDVGQGDGVVVTQGMNQLLIDVGPENKKMLGCLERYMPFWDKKIEAIIISHWDTDHSGALRDIIKSYQVERIFSSSKSIEQNFYTDALRQNDIVRIGKIEFEVLLPDSYVAETKKDDNSNTLVGFIDYKTSKFLFTGDITKEEEQRMVWRKIVGADFMPAQTDTILKISHHGSATGTSEELLQAIKPKVAVISVGAKNKFGHPSKEVLERLEKYGVEVRRTDKVGDIVFTY